MKSNPIHPLFSRLLLPGLLIVLLAATSCRQDENELPVVPNPTGNETATMTFTLNIPGFREAKTRAGVQEAIIQNIAVLLFAQQGGQEKVMVKHVVPNTSLKAITGVTDGYYFSIPITGGTYTRVALVANAETELSSIIVGSTYDALKQVEAVGRYGQKDPMSTLVPDSYIPMYGEYAPTGGFQLKAGLSQTIADEIKLIRMLARVDVVNPVTTGVTAESVVRFVNPMKNGRIWVDAAAYNTGSGYMAPTLPATLQPDNDGFINEARATGNVITYYLNEQAGTNTGVTNYGNDRPCVLLNLKYQGKIYYYRLDYTWDGIKGGGVAPYEKGTYMPVLRNHRYIFTIKEVKGPGFLTIEEALQSPENHTNRKNLVVSTSVIDESYTDVVFNDKTGYYLATSRTAMMLKGKHDNTSTENKFTVLTNYPDGWKTGAYNADGTEVTGGLAAWLNASQYQGVKDSPATLQALTNGKGFKSGYLEVRAGRLYTKVKVRQIGQPPLTYVAEYNLAGGAQYGARPNNATPTPAQTDPNLRWATSHNNDQSGYYNWYVCTGTYEATYNPATKNLLNDVFFTTGAGKDYHLPSHWEWNAIFSSAGYVNYYSSIDYPNFNEAIEISGTKNTYANDYYSTGNGICYALRYKHAIADPYQASAADFPWASDDAAACAFRYERMGTFANDGSLTSQLKVQCVYVGDQTPLPNLKTVIAQESWWTAQPAGKVITRIFPVTGFISPVAPASAGQLDYRNVDGFLWAKTDYSETSPWTWDVEITYVSSKLHTSSKINGYAVRPFANE